MCACVCRSKKLKPLFKCNFCLIVCLLYIVGYRGKKKIVCSDEKKKNYNIGKKIIYTYNNFIRFSNNSFYNRVVYIYIFTRNFKLILIHYYHYNWLFLQLIPIEFVFAYCYCLNILLLLML
jgi:hypothetical protein